MGKVLHESGQALRQIYFPTDSMVSLLSETRDGDSAEIGVVGNDGMVGVELLMGGGSATSRAVVECEGHAYRLPAHWLMDEFQRHGEFMVQTLRYTQSLITQIAQTAVCNRHHSVEQQLCRRLLLAQDRLPGDHLTMTQNVIASLLGVRREGVTAAAGALRKLGAIDYSRGNITVLDRSKLESLSCECYAVVRKETDRLQPYLQNAASSASCEEPPFDSRVRVPQNAH
jgi:CRP-like cAMP-binding protein